MNQIQKLKARLATASPVEAQTIQDLIDSLELETDPLPTAPEVVADGEGCKICSEPNRYHFMNSAQAAA